MFTTPNKAFPVELHTFLPLVHWLPDPQFRSVLRTLRFGELAKVENLNPLNARTLLSLFPGDRWNRVLRVGFLPIPTNLACVSFAQPAD